MHLSRYGHALIMRLIIHWSWGCSCPHHVNDHTLITLLIMHWTRAWWCTDHVTHHALITWLITHVSRDWSCPFKFILSSPFLWCPVLPGELLRRQHWRQTPGTKNTPALRTWKKGKYQLHFLPTGHEEGMASRRLPGAHTLHEHVGWKDCSKVLQASPGSRKCLLAHVNSRGKGGFY